MDLSASMKHRDKSALFKLLAMFAAGMVVGHFCINLPHGAATAVPCDRGPAGDAPAIFEAAPATAVQAVVAPPLAVAAPLASAAAALAAPAAPRVAGGSLALESEAAFTATLRSCLGAECLTAMPAGAKHKARVALLAPPGVFGEALWAFVADCQLKARAFEVELVPTSHAPAYGYGKNHGWTRIVRIVLPLVPSVAAVEEHRSDTLLQLVRWHCRISHVAAHTALLTVHPAVEFRHSPRLAVERLLTFVGIKATHESLDAAMVAFAPVQAALDALLNVAPPDDMEALQIALAGELATTKSLRGWPCGTLWPATAPTDEALRARAKLLAPNCTAPFTKCSVARDRCEQTGKCR